MESEPIVTTVLFWFALVGYVCGIGVTTVGVMKHWCRVGYVDSYRRSFEMLRDNLSPTYENLAKIDIRDSTIIDWDVDEGDHTVKALDENVSVGLGRV